MNLTKTCISGLVGLCAVAGLAGPAAAEVGIRSTTITVFTREGAPQNRNDTHEFIASAPDNERRVDLRQSLFTLPRGAHIVDLWYAPNRNLRDLTRFSLLEVGMDRDGPYLAASSYPDAGSGSVTLRVYCLYDTSDATDNANTASDSRSRSDRSTSDRNSADTSRDYPRDNSSRDTRSRSTDRAR